MTHSLREAGLRANTVAGTAKAAAIGWTITVTTASMATTGTRATAAIIASTRNTTTSGSPTNARFGGRPSAVQGDTFPPRDLR
jgi:hypothetical protein